MTKVQAIRKFASDVLEEKVTIARDRNMDANWTMGILSASPRMQIPQDLDAASDEGDKSFRRDFIKRCPSARGFSNATLTILHECGHWATRSVMNIIEYDKAVQKCQTQEEYMMIPWECLATQWAICWLMCPENRKIAKAFEKNYFGRN